MMNAAVTNNNLALNTIRVAKPTFLTGLRCLFTAMLETRKDAPYDLPADMAARLYL